MKAFIERKGIKGCVQRPTDLVIKRPWHPFAVFYSKPFKIRHSFISLLLHKLLKAYLSERTVKAA